MFDVKFIAKIQKTQDIISYLKKKYLNLWAIYHEIAINFK